MTRWFYKASLWLRSLFRMRRVEQELTDELQFHLEQLIEENIQRGKSPEEARYAALRELGGIDRFREECRDTWTFIWIERLYSDFKLAIRSMMKSPAFTATAVLSLAIGICINATIFTILDALILRPKGFKDPTSVVSLDPRVCYADYSKLKAQILTLSSMTTVARQGWPFGTPEGGTPLRVEIVEPNYFSVLGIGTALGRAFSEQDPRLAKEPTVIISHSLWQSRFGSDPGIIGKQVSVSYRLFTVIGVAQKGYSGAERFPKTDLWVAANPEFYSKRRDFREFQILGRLKPGVSEAHLAAEMEILAPQIGSRTGNVRGLGSIRVHTEKLSSDQKTIMGLVQPFVGLVLVVACMNVSGLLLSRNEERRREVAMRLALGAGRGQLVRQFLIESLNLAALGGSMGILLTYWASTALPNLVPANLRFLIPNLQLNYRVAFFTAVLTGLATLMFGLVPAIRASRTDLWCVLKKDATNARPRMGRLLGRNMLVIGQVAISAVFLVATGLMLCALLRANAADLGFQKNNLLYVLTDDLTGMEELRFMQRIRSLPAVGEVSAAQQVPMYLFGHRGSKLRVFISDRGPAENPEGLNVIYNPVSTNYFDMMGVSLMRGRKFNASDTENAPKVAIVSESMARRYWPREDPIGRFIRSDQPNSAPAEIVGLVRDVVDERIGKPPDPILYLPRSQCRHAGSMVLLLKPKQSVPVLLASLRREMNMLKKHFEPYVTETQDSVIRLSMAPQRASAWLFGILGISAFAMGMAGLYSVVSYSIVRRTHEIGIRMALGAQAAATRWMVLRKGLLLAILGQVAGLPIAFAVGALLGKEIFGISPMEPRIFVLSSALVLLVTLLACYLPARRAAAINPTEAMRCE